MNNSKAIQSTIKRRVSSNGNEYIRIIDINDSITIRIDIAKGRVKNFINRIDFIFTKYKNLHFTYNYYNKNLSIASLKLVLTTDFIDAIKTIYDKMKFEFDDKDKEIATNYIQVYFNSPIEYHYI